MSDIFDFSPRKHVFAVMGNPIKHSKSPQIHQQFARQTGHHIEYNAIHVDLGGFVQAVRNFQANHGQGLNITVPFKIEAFQLADSVTPRAQAAGAVNTLILQPDEKIIGDNTDGYGLVYDLQSHLQWPIRGQHILILGAGGAARGIIQPLMDLQPASLSIANRTVSKAGQLADDFSASGKIRALGYSQLEGQHYDLVINATSASLDARLPPLPDDLLRPRANCYDMMYSARPTAFLQWAQQHQAGAAADGLGMLVGQAAESYYQWLGTRPEIAPVIPLIRQQMQ